MTLSNRSTAIAVLVIFIVAALIEHFMGRVGLCTCGQVHFWVNSTASPELSQQIADWYSFTHIVHGLVLYGIFHLLTTRLRPRDESLKQSVRLSLILTTFAEAFWEVLENSPIIINRYRQTASAGYTGDSILNSMSDICCCLIGFTIARFAPVWLTLVVVVTIELGLAYRIHDNLSLNIIMLIHPFDSIKHWQMHG